MKGEAGCFERGLDREKCRILGYAAGMFCDDEWQTQAHDPDEKPVLYCKMLFLLHV